MGVTYTTSSAATYVPIATQTLGSDSNYITFSSIAGTYTDLIVVVNGKSTTTGAASDCYVRLATGGGAVDTGNNYSTTRLQGDGFSPYSSMTTSQSLAQAGGVPAGTAGANDRGTNIYHFMNYANATSYKTFLSRGNSTASNQSYGSASLDISFWANTGAITSIQFITNGNYASGSVFTLYGILGA